MKHKPILFNMLEGKHKNSGREIIGMVGTRPGAGVTYTGLMLAFYMGEELGKKTAFLECNQHQDMELIQNSYEWSEEHTDSFSFGRITCYKEVGKNHLIDIFAEDYECFILDFGSDFGMNRNEYLRCGTKIVISGSSEWDIRKLMEFSFATENIRGSKSWLYFIPRVNEKTIARLSNEVKRKVWAVPFTEEPTMPSRDTNRLFKEIF